MVCYSKQKIRAVLMLLFWGWLENSGILYIPSNEAFRIDFFLVLLVFVLLSTNDISVESIEMLCS